MAEWDCICEDCGGEWGDSFPEDEPTICCPFCDSENVDAERREAA